MALISADMQNNERLRALDDETDPRGEDAPDLLFIAHADNKMPFLGGLFPVVRQWTAPHSGNRHSDYLIGCKYAEDAILIADLLNEHTRKRRVQGWS